MLAPAIDADNPLRLAEGVQLLAGIGDAPIGDAHDSAPYGILYGVVVAVPAIGAAGRTRPSHDILGVLLARGCASPCIGVES